MRAHRLPVLLLVVGVLIVAAYLDRTLEPSVGSTASAPDVRTFGSVAAPPDALGSTWYCAAGSAGDITVGDTSSPDATAPEDDQSTAGDDAQADEGAAGEGGEEEVEPTGPIRAEHTVVVTNVGEQDRSAVVSVHPGTDDPVDVPIEVPAGSTRRVELAEYAEGPAVAALVEVDGGDVVVDHELVGDTGVDLGPCASASSDVWHFAWGDTSRDVKEVIALFNPYPGDAVVDVRFATSDGIREPQPLTGLVVPGGTVVVADVSAEVPRRDQVSATVTTRSGRIVAERIQVADGSERGDDLPTREGLAVDLGTAEGSEVWVYPYGFVADSARQSVVVYNPADTPAEVDVEVALADGDAGGVEPFELSVRPGSYEVVELADEPRLLDVFGENAGAFSLVVRSLNGVPIVAEVVTTARNPGWTSSTGGALVATQTVFGEPASSAATGDDPVAVVLDLMSTDAEASTTVVVEALDGGDREVVAELELGPGETTSVELEDLEPGTGALVVRSSSPVAAELVTRWSDPWGLSARRGVPRFDAATPAEILLR